MPAIETIISGLQCEKVKPGDKELLKKLERFDCGKPDKKGFEVSQAMLDRLRKYILQDTEKPQIHDLYYVVCDDNDIFLFFSLQASLVFST